MVAELADAEIIISKLSREQYFSLLNLHETYADRSMQNNHERLKKKYYKKPGVIKFIYKLEKVWEDCVESGDYNMVYLMLEGDAKSKANTLCHKWGNKRLSHADFESIYWSAAWEAVEKRYDGTGKHFLYETITMVFYSRVTDFLRHTVGKAQGRFESEVLGLNGKNEKYTYLVSLEKILTDKLFLEQFSSSLPGKDGELFEVLKLNPDADNQELSKMVGYAHREQVRRKKQKLKKDLIGWPDYQMVISENPFWLSPGCRKGRMYLTSSEKVKPIDPWMAIRISRRNKIAG